MNSVGLIGRLTREIECKYTPNTQLAVVRNTIAVRGRKKDQTEFITITAFGKLAEMMDKYLHKGSLIGIIGHIHTGSYESQGRKVYTTEVVIDNLEFLEKKTTPTQETQEDIGDFEQVDEDLPF